MTKVSFLNSFRDRGDEAYPMMPSFFIIFLSALVSSYFACAVFIEGFDIAGFMQYNTPAGPLWLMPGLCVLFLALFAAVLALDKKRVSVAAHHAYTLVAALFLFINATRNQWFEYENALYIVSGCLFLALYTGYLAERLGARFKAPQLPAGRLPAAAAAFLCLFYFVYFSWLGILRHRLFFSQMWDLAWEHQALHNLAWTGVPYSTIESLAGRVNWGDHASFIYFLLAPFYRLFPHAGFLIVVQALATAAAGFLAYLFAARLLKNRWMALALAAVFLLHPSVQGYLLEDFHPNVLALPLFFAILISAERGNFGWTIASLLLLACTREDMAFFSVFVAAFLIFTGKSGGLKRGIALLAAAGASALTAMLVMKLSGGGFTDTTRFYSASDSFIGVLQAIVLNPVYVFSQSFHPDKLQFLAIVSAPFLFMFYRHKQTWLLLFPAFIFGIFSRYYPQFLLGYHYSVMFVCAAFAGTAYFLASRKKKAGPALAITLLALSLLLNYYYGNIFPKSYRMVTTEIKQAPYQPDYNCRDWTGHYTSLKKQGDREAESIMAAIPRKYKVAADHFAAAHVSGRRYLYQIQHYEAADIVIARPGKDTYPGFKKLKTTAMWEFNVKEALLADGSISLTPEGEVAFR